MRRLSVEAANAAMKRPVPRSALGSRKSDNDKRRLLENPSRQLVERLLAHVKYDPSAKHKRHPHLYGLDPFRGERGDATLCDVHADFRPDQMATIPQLVRRGIQAGLIGDTHRVIWTVADDGWIFEARETNRERREFHGYPVRPNEAIAEPVCLRFLAWAEALGSPLERGVAEACRARYGVR